MNTYQKLWRVQLRGSIAGYNPCYVVAQDPTTAYAIVRKHLDQRDYGFTKDRELLTIELVAEDYDYTAIGCYLFLP